MGLENYTGKIADLVVTNPQPTDPKSQGDDHLRGIKYTLKQSFPNFDGPSTQLPGQVRPDGVLIGDGTASENHFWDGSVANQLSLKRGTPEAPGAEAMKVVYGRVATMLGSLLSAKLSGDQVVASGTNTASLLLNSFDVAVGGTLNGTTGEWTPSVAGWYEVSLSIEMQSSTANQMLLLFPKVRKNGVDVITGTGMFGMTFAVNPSQILGVATGLIYMNGTTDVMRAMVTCASGSTAAIIASTTRFNCKLVSIG